MKKLYKITLGSLFTLGLVWAYFAIAFILAPFFLFISLLSGNSNDLTFYESIFLFLVLVPAFINSILGYWVWAGWIVKIRKNRFFHVSDEKYWKLSFYNHLAWIVIIPLLGGMVLIEQEDQYNIFKVWLTGLKFIHLLIWPISLSVLSAIFLRQSQKQNQLKCTV